MTFADTLEARLAARPRTPLDWEGYRRAAVLVPLVVRGGAPAIVFTVLTADLPTHAGQISFPGGGAEARDADATATAVREAEEELGIDPAAVRTLGLLDDQGTPARFVITPVVGLLGAGAEPFRPSPREVAEVFEVDVRALRDPAVFRDLGPVERDGREYWLCAYVVGERNIWGATARIVHDLLPLLDWK